MDLNEKMIFSNFFGTVTDRRIVLNYKTGSEDLPINQITSISYQHERNYRSFLISLFICIGGLVFMFGSSSFISFSQAVLYGLFGLVTLLIAISNWIGHHNIVISSGGKDRKPIKAEMSKTKEGLDFVNAVKKAVIK